MLASKENIEKLCKKLNCTFKKERYVDEEKNIYRYFLINHNNNEEHRFKTLIEIFYYLLSLV